MLADPMALALQVSEGDISSGYSELEDCVEVEGPAPVNERRRGYGGWVVSVGAREHSAGVAYSDRARAEQLAQRPIAEGASQDVSRTIEWRVRRVDAAWRPFATIHRWYALVPDESAPAGADGPALRRASELLVVSVLREDGPIGACHAAYLDVQEIYDVNTVARRFADRMADEFRCGIDTPYAIGAGQAALLMERGRL